MKGLFSVLSKMFKYSSIMLKKASTLALCALILGGLTANARKIAKHVVFIGIDGLSSECFRQASDIPNFKFLMDNGSYTLSKRSVMPSASAINWASIFNGMPTEMHGYHNWNSKVPDIPAAFVTDHGMPPTIYTLLDEQMPSAETGALYNWDGIGYVIDTLAVDFHAYDPGYHDSEHYSLEQYTQRAVQYILEKKPTFFTFYIGDQDEAGHTYGWGSPEYYKCMQDCDRSVGMILQALKDAGIYNDTILIVTSDHGGTGKGHGGFTLKELESPFIVWGRHVKKGYAFPETMMQYDVAATFAYILGLKTPQCWVGRPMRQVFK